MNNDIDPKLLQSLGIDISQVESNGKDLPDYFYPMIDRAKKHCYKTLCGDFNGEECHWKIESRHLDKIFNRWIITGSWRSVVSRLGTCHYTKKRININFGHRQMNKSQCWKTLLHELTHAITYLHFGRCQGHGFKFKFYLHLLLPIEQDKQI